MIKVNKPAEKRTMKEKLSAPPEQESHAVSTSEMMLIFTQYRK